LLSELIFFIHLGISFILFKPNSRISREARCDKHFGILVILFPCKSKTFNDFNFENECGSVDKPLCLILKTSSNFKEPIELGITANLLLLRSKYSRELSDLIFFLKY